MILVGVRFTKAVQADASALDKLRQPIAIGIALARRLKERVERKGQTATPPNPYSGERFRTSKQGRKVRVQYVVSKPYAQAAGVAGTRFRSSKAFHAEAGTRVGTARVTGAMWRGLQVRNSGSNAVVIDFAGSSLGGKQQSTRTAGGRLRSKPVQIRNQQKAATVFRFSHVNVIQPTDSEQEAMGAAVAHVAQRLTAAVLGGRLEPFATTSDPWLAAEIVRHYRGIP